MTADNTPSPATAQSGRGSSSATASPVETTNGHPAAQSPAQIGRALVIAAYGSHDLPLMYAQQIGFGCVYCDEPYAAMRELARRPRFYDAVVLSLTSIYREELAIVEAVRRIGPHLTVWLAQADDRAAVVEDARRYGATGLLDHRGAILFDQPGHDQPPAGADAAHDAPEFGTSNAAPDAPRSDHDGLQSLSDTDRHRTPGHEDHDDLPINGFGDPVLTAEELAALLHDVPPAPPQARAKR